MRVMTIWVTERPRLHCFEQIKHQDEDNVYVVARIASENIMRDERKTATD